MTGKSGRLLAAALSAALVATTAIVAGGTPAQAEEPPGTTVAEPGGLTAEQAAQQAAATGQPVEATLAATGTDTVIASPDGTMTLKRTATPTRARVGGEWKDLDPTLVQNPDGSWSPRFSNTPLKLSNGGAGAMATLSQAGMSAGIVPPAPLRPPTISGDTATYPQVLPGVNLKVTARGSGGFSEVFEIEDEESGQNPDLAKLVLPTELTGITLAVDEDGNITGTDRTGGTVITAPTPTMWDSTVPPASKSSRGPAPDRSTFRGPGTGAQVAKVGISLTEGRIELTPDQKLLTGPATRYPVYVDPAFTWSETGGKYTGWATVAEQFPEHNYWKDTPDPLGRMQVGNPRGEIKSRTFINYPIASTTLAGATIHRATMKITQTRAWSCTPSRVNVYAPDATLTSRNATWNDWRNVNLGAVVDFKSVAHGYDGCPSAGVAFDVKSTVAAAVADRKSTQTFALVAADENSDNGWKEFLETSPTIEITYNHRPDTPTGMTTSPATNCTATSPTAIGRNIVYLYAPVSDRNRNELGVKIQLWKDGAPGDLLVDTNPARVKVQSGRSATTSVSNTILDTAAGDQLTLFHWRVMATDSNLESNWSAVCRFWYDPTTTGTPTVPRPADGTTKIGTSVDIPIGKPVSGTMPTSYAYQINGGPHGTVPADSTGAAQISVTPTRYLNVLAVTSLSSAGNIGATATITFNSDPAEPAIENDLDGDNITDVLAAGGRHNLGSGIWLAAGKDAAGALAPAAVNIGANGLATDRKLDPAQLDGAQVVAGRFSGTGLQDIFAYFPSGDRAGSAAVLRGNGDGTPVLTQHSGSAVPVLSGILTDLNGFDPLQVTNAGYLRNTVPDLIGTTGSARTGYYLSYLKNSGTTGVYESTRLPEQQTPTGGRDWDTWTLAGAPGPDGAATIFLWQKSSGKLFSWRNLAYDEPGKVISYTQRQLSDSWYPGQNVTPYAADVNNDGTVDLWAIRDGAGATASLVSDTGVTPAPGQTVLTASHAWLLNDAAGGPVTGSAIAKDTVGALPATGAGGAAWDSGQLYPSVTFNGTDAMLTTTGPAVRTDADFTISAWVRPDLTTGTILSQDGGSGPAFRLWIEDSDDTWRFSMAATNTASPTWVNATSRRDSVVPGVWTHVSASYKRSTGALDLHVNGKDVARAVHVTPWSATGIFRIGAQRGSGSTVTGYFPGQIAEVLAYDSVVIYDDGNKRIRDFSGDNRTDIMASNGTTGSLFLYRGNGAGQFYRGAATVGIKWYNYDAMVSPGDFNGDGRQDMMVRRASDGALLYFRGNGAGGWLNNGTVIGDRWNNHTAIAAPGDWNSDGFPDIVVRDSNSNIKLYRGSGTGTWIDPSTSITISNQNWSGYARIFSPGDFDGDGHPDLMAQTGPNVNPVGELRLFRGDGNLGLINHTFTVVGTGFHNHTAAFSPGDFNGDGYADVVTREPNGDIKLYRGNGAGGWQNGNKPDLIGASATTWNAMDKFM